ncbi:MAG: AAA domain-containing protein, partial [Bacteroidota bacterium]
MDNHSKKSKLVDRSAVISYFRDCFKSDTRAFVLNNFFSTKVAFAKVIEGTDEILSGHLNRLPLEESYASEVLGKMALQRKEKALYLFSFFITGADTGILDKQHKVCAPLFIHPAKIITASGLHYLEVDFSKSFLNVNFVSKLVDQSSERFYQEINDSFEAGELDFAGIGRLKRALEQHIEGFDGDELLHYPQLTSESGLRKSIHLRTLKSQNGYKAYPAVAIGAINKTESTRGVLNELNELADDVNDHSVLLRALLQNEWPKLPPVENGYIPESLSPAQQNVLKAVGNHVLTQVTGPPGTGKSHTIAALAVNFIAQGKSVLVAGKTNEAVDVVRK